MSVRVSGVEQARITFDTEQFFDKVANIYVATAGQSGSGGRTLSYPATPTSSSPAQLAPLGKETEAWYAEKLGGRQGFAISLRKNNRVGLNDRVKIDGRTFEVLGRDNGRSYWWRQRVAAKELL